MNIYIYHLAMSIDLFFVCAQESNQPDALIASGFTKVYKKGERKMNALKKYALPASLIGGGLIILALVLGLIGAFRGPTAGALKVQATAVATQALADKAEILTAIQNTQGWSDADKAWMESLVSNDDDFTEAKMQIILAAINNAPHGLTDADKQWIQETFAVEVAKLIPSVTPTGGPANPTAPPVVASGRFETAPCNDDAQRWYFASASNPGAVWHVTCFAITTSLNAGEDFDAVYDENLYSIIATPYGAAIVEVYISYGGGDQPTAWLMWSANRDNGGTAAPYAVTITSPYPDWVTLGELMTELHPIGPAHKGLWVFVRYLDLDPTDNMGVKGIELAVP